MSQIHRSTGNYRTSSRAALAADETPRAPRRRSHRRWTSPAHGSSSLGWQEQRLSLAFTTYQAAKLFLVGLQPNDRLSLYKRTIPRCMGMTAHGNSLWVSSLWQLWRFENILERGQSQDGFDRVYVPEVGYVTGDIDMHDMAVDRDGRLVFVNTLFACLATVSETHSFWPLWKPPFVSRLAAEDRCHLNGLAMRDGVPAYATAVSEGDVADGWRDFRRDGGVVIDVAAGEIVLRGLSMPHSPRWYRGRLWLHNSGTGEFGLGRPCGEQVRARLFPAGLSARSRLYR